MGSQPGSGAGTARFSLLAAWLAVIDKAFGHKYYSFHATPGG
jgi:hypothetical protein